MAAGALYSDAAVALYEVAQTRAVSQSTDSCSNKCLYLSIIDAMDDRISALSSCTSNRIFERSRTIVPSERLHWPAVGIAFGKRLTRPL